MTLDVLFLIDVHLIFRRLYKSVASIQISDNSHLRLKGYIRNLLFLLFFFNYGASQNPNSSLYLQYLDHFVISPPHTKRLIYTYTYISKCLNLNN